MLHSIAAKSTELLKDKNIIVSEKENIYIYGFELIYSLLFSVGIMLVWSMLLGCTGQVITFLLCFIPIRMVAGGYHAKSYGSCFLWTNIVTLVSVAAAEWLWKTGLLQVETAVWGLWGIAAIYIAKQTPIVSGKASMKEELIVRNKKIANRLLVVGGIVLVLIRILLRNELSYVGIVAFCVAAFMIRITKKGGT